jgi:hypothetical protein
MIIASNQMVKTNPVKDLSPPLSPEMETPDAIEYRADVRLGKKAIVWSRSPKGQLPHLLTRVTDPIALESQRQHFHTSQGWKDCRPFSSGRVSLSSR